MKIEIHHIPTQGLVLDFEKPAQHFSGLKAMMENGECEFAEPLAIHLDVLPMRDFIRVKGHLDTTLRLACVRCLEVFEYPLRSRFTLNYSRQIPQDVHDTETEGIELTADQIGMVFFEGEEIDFADALPQHANPATGGGISCRNEILVAEYRLQALHFVFRIGDHFIDDGLQRFYFID